MEISSDKLHNQLKKDSRTNGLESEESDEDNEIVIITNRLKFEDERREELEIEIQKVEKFIKDLQTYYDEIEFFKDRFGSVLDEYLKMLTIQIIDHRNFIEQMKLFPEDTEANSTEGHQRKFNYLINKKFNDIRKLNLVPVVSTESLISSGGLRKRAKGANCLILKSLEYFLIVAVDKDGSRCTTGGDILKLPNSQSQIHDFENGIYRTDRTIGLIVNNEPVKTRFRETFDTESLFITQNEFFYSINSDEETLSKTSPEGVLIKTCILEYTPEAIYPFFDDLLLIRNSNYLIIYDLELDEIDFFVQR